MQKLKKKVAPGGIWLIIFLATCLVQGARANPDAPPARVQDGTLWLAGHLSVWVPGRDIPEAEVVAGQYDQHFVRPAQQYLAQGADNWIRFTIENPARVESQWVLNLQSAMISQATLLIPLADGRILRQETGLKFDYRDRPVPYNHFAFPIQQKPDSIQTYYLKISTPFQLYFAPTVTDYPAFLKTASLNFSFGHLCIGLLMGVFVYLLVLYLGQESHVMVSRFIWFVLFSVLIMMYVNGFLMAYLPANEWLTTRLWLILHVCMQTVYLMATQDFFQTRISYPRIHRYLAICIVSASIFFMLIFFVPYTILVTAELYFAAQLIIGVTVISIYVWWKERSKVALFAIGNIGLTTTAALSTFIALGSLTASDWVVQHGFEVGLCWQAVFFTWALSRKINLLATTAAVAEAENKAKNEFIAKMSHEIRTPMNGVIGMVQMLQNTPINTQQKHYLSVIDSSGKILLAVINDILDYSRLAAGKIELHPHTFNLDDLLSEIKTLFGDMAHEKHLSFSVITAPDVPLLLQGDSIRLRQILINLLSNAFKFTDHGHIRLEVFANSGGNAREVEMRFVISDTGIGIDTEDQEKLFKSFSQLHNRSSRQYGGSGLGLSICKQLVEIMGGGIEVSSRKGRGAEFSFFIKLLRAEATETESFSKKEIVPLCRRILVAEDNSINCEVISTILKKYGCSVQTVFNGRAAVDIFCQQPDAFDMILMDCEMPVMDGIQACREIRQQESRLGDRKIPIIALTAHVSEAHRKLCEEAGMSGYLIKPISFSQIEELLSRKLP